MTITLFLDKFLYTLFQDLPEEKEALKRALEEHYIIEGVKPEVELKSDSAVIHFNTSKIEETQKKFDTLVYLCEGGEFEKAKELGEELISINPTNSEYFRILGQVHSELGNHEESINYLIDALKWNPKNGWALLMMGNVYAKEKKDIETAMVYYNQVLAEKPDDEITLNNIGAVLMQTGNSTEAIEYFNQALEANPDYSNTYLALGLVAEKNEDYFKAFDNALEAIEKCKVKDQVYNNAFGLAVNSAKNLSDEINSDKIIAEFVHKLSEETGKEIKVEEESSISTAAKIEFAENYNRDYHLIKYKPTYPAVAHLIAHELMHLELAEEARKEDKNELFIFNQTHETRFIRSLEKDSRKLQKRGIPETSINNFLLALFNGLNSQIFNTPIDLFIEDRIYNRFTKLRPFQFLSLINLIHEGIKATTDKEIVKNAPKRILSTSKILNLINALHFKQLYKIDLFDKFQATPIEVRTAEELYEEFLEYKTDKEPGEEYELIQHWAEDLKTDIYFELVPESEHRRKTIDSVLNEIGKDPFGLEEENPSQERLMKKFIKENSSEEVNMAVTMYMVDAINYFKNMRKTEVKKIAFEVATIGMAGIDPNKKGYSIPSIENSSFSGYKTLAYYYVSWAKGIPEMLKSLQLPFDKEYDLASKFIKE